MATLHAFDTLAYTKALVDRGYERDKAEALAEAQREFFVKELASEDFVRAEIDKVRVEIENVNNKIDTEIEKIINKIDASVSRLDSKIEREIIASENRMMMANAKMLAFAVGVILAGLPIIQAFLAKLG